MKNNKGITLIALVVTIIVLIILAGVSIQLLLGNNGIIRKAKQGKENYEEANIIEKVEIALLDYNSEKITKLEEPEVEEALNKLFENETFDSIEKEENIGVIEDYEITLGKEKGEVVIIDKEQVIGKLRIRYQLSTRDYTKGPMIITVRALGEISEFRNPENEEIPIVEGKAETTYRVDKNGTYTFIARDKQGNTKEKSIVIDKIDFLNPQEFMIRAENVTADGFTIIAETVDAIATKESACSGIEKYEYHVSSDGQYYETYSNNVITGLEQGSYKVYVTAYDKVGNQKESEPIEVKITTKFVKIATGHSHCLAIDTQGTLWSWGYNAFGQLGNGTAVSKFIETPQKIRPDIKFMEIEAGDNYSLALDDLGRLWTWGRNSSSGILGDGTKTDRHVPMLINTEVSLKKINTHSNFCIALDKDGFLWGWGYGGAVGIPLSNIPKKLEVDMKFKEISVGYNHFLALNLDNFLYACGRNDYGQIGNGEYSTRNALTCIMDNKKFLQIATSNNTSFAIDNDGKMWSWGMGESGVLGNGKTENVNIPIIVTEDITFQKIVCNSVNAIAIDNKAKVWAWGKNSHGNVGDGTRTPRNTPVEIKKDTKFKEIAVGPIISLAIDENGDLWYWGNAITVPTLKF